MNATDISPQRVRTAEFGTVKRGGYDPDEVRAFLNEVAAELERAQNQSTAMEARARAAVARLQELSESASEQGAAEPAAPAEAEAAAPAEAASIAASVDEAETISRTLLLAQRTADTTVAEAEAEATRIRTEAETEATRTLDSAREMTSKLMEEAETEARKAGEVERNRVEGEVNALRARRDFLESDVDHLEAFLVDQRSRLRDAATELIELVERVPGGLGETRRPLLSGDDGRTSEPAADIDTDTVADDGWAGDGSDDDTAATGLPMFEATDDIFGDAGADAETDAETGVGDDTGEIGAFDDEPATNDHTDEIEFAEGDVSSDDSGGLVIDPDLAERDDEGDDGPSFSYDRHRG